MRIEMTSKAGVVLATALAAAVVSTITAGSAQAAVGDSQIWDIATFKAPDGLFAQYKNRHNGNCLSATKAQVLFPGLVQTTPCATLGTNNYQLWSTYDDTHSNRATRECLTARVGTVGVYMGSCDTRASAAHWQSIFLPDGGAQLTSSLNRCLIPLEGTDVTTAVCDAP